MSPNDIHSPSIAIRYVECIPHVSYSAVGINPKGFSTMRPANHVLKML